jgi:hypothetical protein
MAYFSARIGAGLCTISYMKFAEFILGEVREYSSAVATVDQSSYYETPCKTGTG